MMIRGFFRLIGLFLLVIGFLSLVYDGARTIADLDAAPAIRQPHLAEALSYRLPFGRPD